MAAVIGRKPITTVERSDTGPQGAGQEVRSKARLERRTAMQVSLANVQKIYGEVAEWLKALPC